MTAVAPTEPAPGLALTLITDPDGSSAAQDLLERQFLDHAAKTGEVTLGFQGGSLEARAARISEENIWAAFRDLDTRFWNAFGFGDPFSDNVSIVVEANPPHEGVNRRLGGAFARDDDGGTYLVHRGLVGGGRAGVGKKAFLDSYEGHTASLYYDGRKSQVAVVGRVDGDDFVSQVATFVRAVEEFKAQAVQEDPPVGDDSVQDDAMHVLLKWAPDLGTDTIEEHRSLAEANGWTWWGRWGTATTADWRVEKVNKQIEDGISTYAYLRGGDEVWRAKILHMTKEESEVDTDHLPNYYSPSDCSLFLRLTDFEELDPDWPEKNLVLDSGPENRDGVENALRGQSSTLWVRHAGYDETILKVAPGAQAERWDECLEGGFVCVGWDELDTDLRDFESKEELVEGYKAALGEDTHPAKVTRETSDLWSYRNLEARDIIIANRGRSEIVGVGRVTEPGYEYVPDRTSFRHIVHVDWDDSLSGPISEQDASWSFTIRPVSRDQYEEILRELKGEAPIGPPPSTSMLTMEWLVEQTLSRREDLDEIIEVLESDTPQVVLAGPPGTGKTWIARHIARYLVDDDSARHRTVQFHPSFGYEEFIEGLRPKSDEGAIKFEREDGVVLAMAKNMKDGDSKVLIIDEMNRANLPRVFGELMYLFEYRDEPISLQYTRHFRMPEKLMFIGTMNTADRSIRSIDIALRRRFDVFECQPDSNILRRYYARDGFENEVHDLIQGMEALNERLEAGLDRHHTIGHTFFMHRHMTPRRLRGVWERKLKPLIEEYFFDEPDVWREYGIAEFWPSLSED